MIITWENVILFSDQHKRKLEALDLFIHESKADDNSMFTQRHVENPDNQICKH